MSKRNERLKQMDERLVKFEADHPWLFNVLAAVAVAVVLILGAALILALAVFVRWVFRGAQ